MIASNNKILIIEDCSLNLKVLVNILDDDYILYTAKDGFEGMQKVLEFSPDLILLDVILPKMDGYEIIKELKSSPKTRNIPVIFISGLSSIEDEKKGLAMGVVDYITKPFDPVIVQRRVEIHMKIINQMKTIELLSTTDQLTDVPNRRCFDMRLNMEWNRAIREEKELGILLLDIDHFKIYNDTYGHLQGDEALKCVGQILKDTFKRSFDYMARWGGEEFIALLPSTSSESIFNFAEMLRLNIENAVIHGSDDLITNVTVSIGVYSLIPTQNFSLSKFIARADQALYKAKQEGRNRVVFYKQDKSTEEH